MESPSVSLNLVKRFALSAITGERSVFNPVMEGLSSFWAGDEFEKR